MNGHTYWVAVKFYRGGSDVMLRQNLQKNPSSVKQTMRRYGGKLVVEGKNIMIFSGTKGSFVWVRQRIDDQTIADCQKLLFGPEIQKLDSTKKPSATFTIPVIFRKWYKAASKGSGDGCWYVVRADKKDSKGTYVGPIRITGKSWRPIAVEQAKARNREILKKREETAADMRRMGWTDESIQQVRERALADVRKEMGDDYKEEDP